MAQQQQVLMIHLLDWHYMQPSRKLLLKRFAAVGLFYSRGEGIEKKSNGGKPEGQEEVRNTDIYTRGDSGSSSYFYSSAAPSLTLISKRRSTGCRQIGQRFVWNLKTFAHPLHMHCIKKGNELCHIQYAIVLLINQFSILTNSR